VHRVPLTPPALDILNKIKRQSQDRELVFPGENNPDSHASVFMANTAIKRSLALKGQLVAHGMRAIVSTTLMNINLIAY